MAATLEGWISYAAARGDAIANDEQSAAALVRGADFIEFFYVQNFATSPAPEVIDAAIYEAAKIELGTPGLFNRVYTPGEARVLTEVKGIKWTAVGDAKAEGALSPTSTKIEAMLGQYVSRKTGLGMRSLG
ncbi:hypothetical protein [Rhodovulum sp. FJ3]|uniref:hypothetical protein n=1 Tax=Rhodovulum sp. FJ3 TaxID=3079053 RepID=UPI00293DB449|nr:hypothetical protein [Rhodovulum sp. FJ3]MDV4167809.1 hypothetical protein [Rhodovulum sp. FJ3]